jgi:16S rRNA (uracil1498-N3)-methyltransferase
MQRYFAKGKVEDSFLLEDGDLHHIKNVMRMEENEKIEVVYEHILYLACIENVKQHIKIRMLEEVKKEEEKLPKITLYIPFLKEQKLDYILQKSTELGVSKICFIPLERSVIKPKQEKEEKKLERWNRILKEASEQSKRVTIPTLEIKNTLTQLDKLDGLNLMCSTKNNIQSIKKVVKKNEKCDRINVVIGPEGGLTETEEQLLIRYHFIPVTLGTRIMRAETVPLYILSVLNYEFME